jgi:hypothetical protein
LIIYVLLSAMMVLIGVAFVSSLLETRRRGGA